MAQEKHSDNTHTHIHQRNPRSHKTGQARASTHNHQSRKRSTPRACVQNVVSMRVRLRPIKLEDCKRASILTHREPAEKRQSNSEKLGRGHNTLNTSLSFQPSFCSAYRSSHHSTRSTILLPGFRGSSCLAQDFPFAFRSPAIPSISLDPHFAITFTRSFCLHPQLHPSPSFRRRLQTTRSIIFVRDNIRNCHRT